MALWKRVGLLNVAKKYDVARQESHVMQEQASPRSKKNKQDQSTLIGADFSHFEYAIERNILETPLLDLSYFFDVAGEVPEPSDRHENVGVEAIEIGNGDIDVAPDWGFDIIIHGGVLRYGPWADRQSYLKPERHTNGDFRVM
ncbi:hypothetical protein C0993_000715 [Termitomyces sp. T159_Od127]|nr:hypothetical protein C0993_000715 [Termitomyces sp. T159_Od127]